MKAVIVLCLSLGSAVVLSQCSSSPRPQHASGSRPALSAAAGGSNVTTQRLGDSVVTTRTLIHHALTNADIGKTYQEITVVSPRGKSVQERVIVHALPRLETENVTKHSAF